MKLSIFIVPLRWLVRRTEEVSVDIIVNASRSGRYLIYLFSTVLLGFLFSGPLYSQFAPPTLRHLSVENGLSQNSVYCMVQDHEGFLWFGTADGLNKYDGYEITIYRHHHADNSSLVNNTIRWLMEDREGTIWIDTDEGLSKYDRKQGRFIRLVNTWCETMLEDHSGTLWLGTPNGLMVRQPHDSTFELYKNAGESPKCLNGLAIKIMVEDRHNNIWIGTNDGLNEIVYNTGQMKSFPRRLNPGSKFDDNFTSMVEDTSGILWMGTLGNGLLSFDPTTGDAKQFTNNPASPHPFADDMIHTLYPNADGSLLVGTAAAEILSFDPGTGRARPLIEKTGKPDLFNTKNARCILKDRSGIFWIGTDGDGVYQYDPRPNKFLHILAEPDRQSGLSGNFLKSVYEDYRGIVWVGTFRDGLTRWNRSNNQFTQYRLAQTTNAFIANTAFAITGDSMGNLWIGTEKGLVEYSDKARHFTLITPKGTNEELTINVLYQTSTGNVLVGTTIGLFTFNPSNKILARWPSANSPCVNSVIRNITAIFEDEKGIIWIGSYGGGLSFYNPGNELCGEYLHDENDPNSISSISVKSILGVKNGLLWIGTEHGLNRFDISSKKFTSFYEEDGLANSYIYGILEDDHGNLWLSSNKGITKFNPADHSIRNFGTEDGLQSNEFNSGAYFKNIKGEMYFGGVNGLNLFHPDSLKDNPVIPKIALTGFKKLDMPANVTGEPSELKEIYFHDGDKIFSFQFSALEFTNPAKNHYAYMMEGFEKQWIYSGTRREVRYTQLDPGEYTFRAKCSNNDGVWNERGMAIKIIIIPPFWKQWWFLSITGVVALAATGGSVRYVELRRVRKKLEKLERERAVEMERSRISRDMHDEIGSSLTKIAILGELVNQNLSKPGEAQSYTQKISETARTVVDSMSEIIWAIDPKNDKLENLVAYIREYASEYIEMAGITCRFEFPEQIPAFNLSAEVRRNIFLTVKEAIHNIIKHSHANVADFKLHLSHHQFELNIHDNGSGFDIIGKTGSGSGLINMKKRIEQIGGQFHLSSELRQGTTLQISIPTPHAV